MHRAPPPQVAVEQWAERNNSNEDVIGHEEELADGRNNIVVAPIAIDWHEVAEGSQYDV